ncbi:MAG: 50S ribosomal protein L33 [Candidatus Paralactobacillus gallistercoris]|uniref:Large ribosomal subunit protein bL33 n=1 Tax=Candidatus Paralactobacillus gallistercoris TaxID=2838724 RepID=A0A948TK35_9LACO|nr:50S ribosomal protein L33 [Candidatus Paralactobacillus gallistercoris]
MSVRKVPLACSVCGSHNYFVPENKKRTVRLELNKFCKRCGKVTLHKETR